MDEASKASVTGNTESTAPKVSEAATRMASAIMAAVAQRQQQHEQAIMVHTSSSALLETVLKIMDDERERLYQTRQTHCQDVRVNNAWLNTLFSGVGPVSYSALLLIIEHWKDGVAARRQVGGFQ